MTGTISANLPGTTTISYTSTNGKSNSIVVNVHPAAGIGLTPTIPAPSTLIAWGANPSGFTSPQIGETIRWYISNVTGSATVNPFNGSVRGESPGDVSVLYKITENATGKVIYKSSPVTVLIPNTPRVNTSAPYIDGGTIPGNYSLSTNVNLSVAIQGENNALVIFSNPRSSNPLIATATIAPPNSSGHVFLNVTKVGSGLVNITFDYTDIHSQTGTMTWTFHFQ